MGRVFRERQRGDGFAVKVGGAQIGDRFVAVLGPNNRRAVGLEPFGQPLAGDQVELGFLDGRIAVELEVARFEHRPVAADVARIEGDANALERPGRIVGSRLRLIRVGQRRAGAVVGGKMEGEERVRLRGIGENDHAFVVDVGIVPKGAVGGVDLVDQAGEFLARDGSLIGFQRGPVGCRGEGRELSPAGQGSGEDQAKRRPAQKAEGTA